MYVIKTTLTIYFFPKIRDFSISRSSKWTGSLSFSRGMCTHPLLAHFNPPNPVGREGNWCSNHFIAKYPAKDLFGISKAWAPWEPLPPPTIPSTAQFKSYREPWVTRRQFRSPPPERGRVGQLADNVELISYHKSQCRHDYSSSVVVSQCTI